VLIYIILYANIRIICLLVDIDLLISNCDHYEMNELGYIPIDMTANDAGTKCEFTART
jgi:hypothetical protein